MSDVTDDDLARLERLCEAATEGPWYTVFTDDESRMNAVYVGTVDRGSMHDNTIGMDGHRRGEIIAATLIQVVPTVDHESELWDENADFIAESRTAMPRLIAEIRRLRAGNQLSAAESIRIISQQK